MKRSGIDSIRVDIIGIAQPNILVFSQLQGTLNSFCFRLWGQANRSVKLEI